MRIAQDDLVLDGDLGTFAPSWSLQEPEPGVVLARLTLTARRPAILPELTARFSTPSVGVAGNWSPRTQVDRVSRWGNRVTSRATTNAPMMTHYDAHESNRITVALSDTMGRVDLGSYVREEDVRFHFRACSPKRPPLQIGTKPLMSEIMERLRAINPDVMIEFRQPYIGSLMRKYANMFRGTDCPNDAVSDRVRTLDLRFLSGKRPYTRTCSPGIRRNRSSGRPCRSLGSCSACRSSRFDSARCPMPTST